jgi:uncharacterized membrane protein
VRWFTRCLTPGVWAIVASFLVVMPAAAAGPIDSSPRTTHLTTTLSPATLSALQSQAASAQATTAADAGGTSFLKTKKGAAVIVLLGAGFGYALYSKSHDRVMSPVR